MPVSGGTTRKLAKRVLAPAQEDVALAVARELEVGVELEGVGPAEVVDLDGVVDHQFDRLERVDPRRVAAEPRDRVAHGREVDDRRHAGEVLEQHAGRRERDLLAGAGRRVPVGERRDVGRPDEPPVLVAQQVLEQDPERERQPRHARVAGLLEGRQAADPDGPAFDDDVRRASRTSRGVPFFRL